MGERESASASSELVIDIADDLEPILWPECCIYKVPRDLRKVNEEAYTPQLISIGPLRHNNKKLADMEKQKSIYLREFCKRPNVTLENFVSNLKNGEFKERIRHFYAEKSELCDGKYIKMILLDAVFIIELFIRECEVEKHEDDYMLSKPWLKNGVQRDLLLFENQLPYFVLNNLYESAFPANHQTTFHELTCKYFKNYKPEDIIIPNQEGVLHFTDLLRYFMSNKHPFMDINQAIFPFEESSRIKNLVSASKLHEAGVEFKGIEKACLTDIDFDKGKLIMPQFEVYDNTECVIRNIMALEQCHYPYETYICNYIFLMDYLINTANDVDLLVEKGVIVNWIGSNEAVAKMVNKLSLKTIESNFCYNDICKDLNKHYKKRRHRAMKTLRSVYFANIWRGTATVTAVILLVMSLLQTINSFRQLH